MSDEARRSVSRRELERQPAFEEISADVGLLDESALDDLWAEDPDQALELLAMMANATDRDLAAHARRLASRLLVDLSASGPARSRGVGRLVVKPAGPDSNELDIDASLEAIHEARSQQRRPRLDELSTREWSRPETAICLLVDRSGSMSGSRLATAALAAAACSWRAPGEFSLLAFSDGVLTLKGLHQRIEPTDLVATVLRLRGHGTTDIDLALKAAQLQLVPATARRRLILLLSDGEHTAGRDPVNVAKGIRELAIVAPADESDHAVRLGREAGATVRTISGPLDIVPTLNAVLS